MRRTRLSLMLATLVATLGVAIVMQAPTPADEGNMTGLREHPCALVNPEMVQALRAKAAETEPNRFGFATADVWAELLADADRFLEAEPYHYSVNIQRDPAKEPVVWEYTLSDQAPPRHEGINYPPWTAMTQEQRDDAITVRLKSLSFAYLVTGERRYAERARQIAMHLVNWQWWSDPDYGRGIACLDTGHITKCMGLFYDWCFDTLTDEERARVREAIAEKGCEKILEGIGGYPPETNGYAVLTSGLGVAGLAIRPEDPRGGLYLQRAIEFTRTSLDLSGEDGGLFEGPMYGTYLLDNLAHIFDAVTAAGVETDLLQHPFLATMEEYVISQMAPDSREMPCFGDGSPGRCYPETMSVLANNGSQAAAWYLQQIGFLRPETIHQFIRFDPDALDPEQPTFNPSRALVDVGLVSLKAGYEPHTPYLCMKSGPPSTSVGHAHFDSNAIVLSFLGEWLISDRGYRARHDPPATKFTQGSTGHSTMVMDIDDGYLHDTTHPSPGHDQVSRAGARIEEFFSSEVLDYVRGQAAETYNTDDLHVLDSFAREILYFKPDLYVMVDDIRAPQQHTYNITLQAATSSVIEHVAENAWQIRGLRGSLQCFLFSPEGLESEAMTYPGAERYGEFLRARTPPATQARIVTLMYPSVSEEGGLVQNAGFEHGMVGWRPRANEDLPNHVIDEEVFRSGNASGRIDGSGYYYGPRLPLDPGTTVAASAWLRTEGVTEGGGRLAIHFWDTSGDAFEVVSTDTVAPEDWRRMEVETVAPEGTVAIDIGLYFRGDGVGWWDDAEIEADVTWDTVSRPPIRDVAPLDGGGRGITATVGDRQYVLVTAGEPVAVGESSIEHDGAFAAICREGDRARWVYLQRGTSLTIDGEAVLQAGMDEPVTVAVWRGDEPGVAHLRMQRSLQPHAPAVHPGAIRLRLRLAEPVERVMASGQELPVTGDGDVVQIGG
ncbi:MAG: heparinase II/III family protein [Armatimonadota bacterium]|nr:heparinase II/III family protein [Armatimonadota bacterium]